MKRKGGGDGGHNESLVKYGALATFTLATAKAYSDLRRLTVKDVVQSNFYKRWRDFNAYLVEKGWYPKYYPVGLNGKIQEVPSKSPPVYAKPPKSVSESRVLQQGELRGLKLRNRIIRAAAFDGESEAEIIQTHVSQAKGGVGMTTVAYCCVSREGLTFEGQIVMESRRREFLQKLTSEVHKHGAAICAQLTHAGSFADRTVTGTRQLAPSSVFNIAGFDWPKEMSKSELNEMANKFANAAKMSKECGFDCIELHVGHGYLLSQFLCPRTNVRTDQYGGNAVNRARFPIEVLKRCRDVVGENFPIVVKLNMHDGHANGLELEDAVVAADMLADASADLLVLTCGSIVLNGLYMLRGTVPFEKLAMALPSSIERIACAVFGPLAVPETEYDDCFLRESSREVKRIVGHKVPICLMGGVSSFSAMEGAMQEGFEFVQIARTLIREPDFVNRIYASLQLNENFDESKRNPVDDIKSLCIRCNQCVIATVDPSASFGCPFQKLDAKKRRAQKLDPVLNIEDMKRQILKERGISSPAEFKSVNALPPQDIEDMLLNTKSHL